MLYLQKWGAGFLNDQLTDSQGRSVKYMRVSVTDRCNLRCRYCVPSVRFTPLTYSDIITYEEIERLARILAARGVSSIRITGGEPLVRRHLDRLVHSLSQVPGISDISLTTNGLLLEEAAPSLKKAGLSRVNVSLDSLREDRFTWITNPLSKCGNGNPGAILRGLEASRQAGLEPVKINVVLIRGFNDDELEHFVDLTRDHHYEVRFIEFMPLGPEGFWGCEKIVSAAEAIDRLKVTHGSLIPLEKTGKSGPAVRYRIPGYTGIVGFITPISQSFCVHCNRIRITADGKLRTCLFSDNETDLLIPMRNGTDDNGILAIIESTLKEKPERHSILDGVNYKSCARSMSHIGG
jgi:cyclic pyranopterin phosphate synthase